METYTKTKDKAEKAQTLNLITHVEVEQSHKSDANALIPAIEETKEQGLAPKEVLADSLYGGDDNCHSACFNKSHCSKCDKRKGCPVKEGKKYYYLRYTDKELRVALRRSYEKTDEFIDRYRWRTGVEATMPVCVRSFAQAGRSMIERPV
jgi:hypothetical protein